MRPVSTSQCKSVLDSPAARKRFPKCASHISYVRKHADSSPCYGGLGQKSCEGFQLDTSDACNVQYYLFCERLFKPKSSKTYCPSPDGYPDHCCYGAEMEAASGGGGARPREPGHYLLQIFPDRPVFRELQ